MIKGDYILYLIERAADDGKIIEKEIRLGHLSDDDIIYVWPEHRGDMIGEPKITHFMNITLPK